MSESMPISKPTFEQSLFRVYIPTVLTVCLLASIPTPVRAWEKAENRRWKAPESFVSSEEQEEQEDESEEIADEDVEEREPEEEIILTKPVGRKVETARTALPAAPPPVTG